jgi:hypothetical protein
MVDEPSAEPTDAIEIPEPEGAEPQSRGFTIPERQEWARTWLALSLVAIFGVEVTGSMVALWVCGARLQELKDILTLVLGPTVALVGSATGFYFASRSRTEEPSQSPPP